MQALERMSATQRHTQQEPKYRELLRITGQVLESARQVVKKTAKIKGVDVLGGVAIDQLRQQITAYCDLGENGSCPRTSRNLASAHPACSPPGLGPCPWLAAPGLSGSAAGSGRAAGSRARPSQTRAMGAAWAILFRS